MNPVSNRDPYGQAQYTGVFTSPSPVIPQASGNPNETEKWPVRSETLTKIPTWTGGKAITWPALVSPAPTPPKDSLVTSPLPPIYSVVTSPSPPTHFTAHPGGLPTWSSVPPLWGATHPFVPTSLSMPAPTSHPVPYYPMGAFPPHPTTVAPTMSRTQEPY